MPDRIKRRKNQKPIAGQCKPGTVLNSRTGNCVLIGGATYFRLLAEGKIKPKINIRPSSVNSIPITFNSRLESNPPRSESGSESGSRSGSDINIIEQPSRSRKMISFSKKIHVSRGARKLGTLHSDTSKNKVKKRTRIGTFRKKKAPSSFSPFLSDSQSSFSNLIIKKEPDEKFEKKKEKKKEKQRRRILKQEQKDAIQQSKKQRRKILKQEQKDAIQLSKEQRKITRKEKKQAEKQEKRRRQLSRQEEEDLRRLSKERRNARELSKVRREARELLIQSRKNKINPPELPPKPNIRRLITRASMETRRMQSLPQKKINFRRSI